jgi:Domain of unknown function (DUF6379)
MLTDHVIADGSLQSERDGFRFDLRMPWYRALPLSSLEGLEVTIDGEPVPSDALQLELGERTYRLGDLPPLYDDWWFVADPIVVHTPHAIEGGEHELDVTIALRIPYIIESGHALVMRERCVKRQAT